jgi:phosphoribosylanthranilate isomerase
MVRVKICGIRRAEDARVAVEAGADLLGFNFWKGGPRYIAPREAAAIITQIPQAAGPKELWTVGVFVDEQPEHVLEIARESGVRVLQFHGSESPEYWERFATFPRIKAFKVGAGFDPAGMSKYRSAAAYLLDAAVNGMHGGTGRSFDWSLAEQAKAYGNILLAGGLTVENVGEAVRRLQPWGVDVASGVESEPGKKDPARIREFIRAVRDAEKEIAEGVAAIHAEPGNKLSKTRH